MTERLLDKAARVPTRPWMRRMRTLYLSSYSQRNQDWLLGKNLVAHLQRLGDVLVRHYCADSRQAALDANPGFPQDPYDFEEFESFAPDAVFIEGRLYAYDDVWKFPRGIAEPWVRSGGVLVLAGVDREELGNPDENWSQYQRDLPFFGGTLNGNSCSEVRYIRDEVSFHHNPSWIVCNDPGRSANYWLEGAFKGIDRLEAISAVELSTFSPLVYTSDTASVLAMDHFVHDNYAVPFGSVAEHALGYAAVIAASMTSDIVVDHCPDNALWIGKLLTILSDSAKRNKKLLADPETSDVAPDLDSAAHPRVEAPLENVPLAELVSRPEDHQLEMKQTARFNVRTEERDARLEHEVAAALAGFWNSDGGVLLIGVVDRSGEIFGIESDARLCGGHKDADAFVAWLSNSILKPCFAGSAPHVRPSAETLEDKAVCRIDVPRGTTPVYLDDKLPVRLGNTTTEFAGAKIVEYIRTRFPN